jgi:hypothetical protein
MPVKKPEIVAGTDAEDPIDIAAAAPASPPDPFNAEALRLPPDFEQTAGVKKVLADVPVRSPHSQEWFCVHPDPAFRGTYGAIKLKEQGEYYLLTGKLAAMMPPNEIITVTIYTVMTKAGVLLLWPVRLPATAGRRSDRWATSAHEAALEAMEHRIKMVANMAGGFYERHISRIPIEDSPPAWPELPFFELLRLGFVKEGRFVSDMDHPVIKLLHEG